MPWFYKFECLLYKNKMLDTYNTPYYKPYPEEIECEVEKEGSFTLDRLELVSSPWDCVTNWVYDRAVNESMICSHFGEDIMDPLFNRFTEILAADTKEVEHVSLVVSLIRKKCFIVLRKFTCCLLSELSKVVGFCLQVSDRFDFFCE